MPSVDSLKLKDPKDFRYLGKGEISIVDLRDITVGTAHYGIDTRLPGMKYAVIARPPVTGGKVVSFDATEAMKVSGVEKVMEVKGWPWPSKFQPLGGVAVIARNTGAAIKGRDALKIVWDDGANAKYDSVAYRTELEEAARKPGLVVRKEGDVDAALKGAAKVITGEYYLPHLAHASMEPPVAVANVKDGKAEIWAPVQSPGGTREDVAKTLGIPEDSVTVNVTLLGGGFGRKSKCDFALEAALLSKELGVPVKVQWTREDDLHHDFLHTVSVERIEAGLDKQQQGGGLAAPQRRAQHRLDICRRHDARDRHSNSAWVWSTCRSRSPTSNARIRKPPPIPASAGSARCRTSRAPLRCNRWWANWPTPPAATRRRCCWS